MKQAENKGQDRKEAAYPYYDLESCIKFSEHIRNLGGSKGVVRKSLLAKQVGLSESTPSFFQKLSACKVFCITQGWGNYSLTDLGKQYFYPQSENDKQEALLEIFRSPEAFRLIIDRFDGEKLPSTAIMGNIFHQELAIPDSWKDRVAQIFVRSAQFAGIIDTGGFLRYRAAVHSTTPTEVTEPGNPQSDLPVKRHWPPGQFVNPRPIGQQPDTLVTGGPLAQQPMKYRRVGFCVTFESGEALEIPKMTEDDFNLLMETLKLWKARLIKSDREPSVQSESP